MNSAAAVSSALSYAPAAHLIDRQRKALSVFGPPFARRCAFWVSALVALVEGLALGALGLLFFNAFTWLSDRWLTTSRYREQLDAGAFGPGDGGRWYWPVQMAAAGLAVGLVVGGLAFGEYESQFHHTTAHATLLELYR